MFRLDFIFYSIIAHENASSWIWFGYIIIEGEQLCSMEFQRVDLQVFSFVPKWEESLISLEEGEGAHPELLTIMQSHFGVYIYETQKNYA